ncbi:P-loop NTPase fold protein [Pedococcus sp. 5OH_020]|uniref:P-loop NTPase fold protein n=1 Tax=Pedococcus sp. 5OH_020 TaxID=2989814 RepID=UPI0022E9EAEE|nr:P-loop NTPase fold protein [Pedococcus sp. 5OH_020]
MAETHSVDAHAGPGRSWLVDTALERSAEDGLGRKAFISRARELLNEIASTSDSTVIGVVGPWGSGKTSSVNMIVEGLETSRWRVKHLTPWAVSGPDAIIAELLAAISAAIPKTGSRGEAAQKALKKYGSLVSPALLAIPFAGAAAKGLTDAVLQRVSGEGTVHERTRDLAEALTDLAQPILLIVDDVDRLQPDELLALFKAVRVLGRLPYVHYLLAYDQQTLLDVLSSTALAARDTSRPLSFLEKIVALPLEQPPTRPEQAQSLFENGLTEVLRLTGHAALTEDQQERIAEEREQLLNSALTEPRTIRRFLSQLRIYLPLIGHSEIDIVDFLVVTLLRTTYPALYRRLTARRMLLVRRHQKEGQEFRSALLTEVTLTDLSVPLADQAKVRAALVRLFPLLGGEGHSQYVYEEDRRRRDRRVSDPDTVARYFALGPISGDLPDATLLAVLDEWTVGDEVESADALAVRRMLTPDLGDAGACDAAAIIVRRASSRTDQLSPPQAAHLLRVVVGLLPNKSGLGGGAVGLEGALVAWVSRLLAIADGPEPADLLQVFTKPPGVASPLPHLLRAIRLTRDDGQSGRDAVPVGPSWYARMVDATVSLVWLRFLENVRAGDEAPEEPAGMYLNWLEGSVGRAEIDRRLRAALEMGVEVPHLAARFVETATDLSGQNETLMGFDPTAFATRVGLERVRSDSGVQEALAAQRPEGGHDENNVSWKNRRLIAIAGIVRTLQDDPLVGQSLPTLEPMARGQALLNHRPDLMRAPGQAPDLLVRVAVQVSTEPGSNEVASQPFTPVGWQGVERQIKDVLSNSPVARWLRSTAPSWHVRPGSWELKDADPGRRLEAQLGTSAIGDQASPSPRQPPLRIGAQVLVPEPHRLSELENAPVVYTLAVGLWMAELGPDRRPSDARSAESPFPAALTLREATNLLAAMIAAASDAIRILAVAQPQVQCASAALVDIAVESPRGLGAAVDLRHARRLGTSARADFGTAISLEIRSLGEGTFSFSPSPEEVSVGVLSDWLLRAGYRDFEGALTDLLNHQG